METVYMKRRLAEMVNFCYKIVIALSATCRIYTAIQESYIEALHKTNGTAKDKAKHKG